MEPAASLLLHLKDFLNLALYFAIYCLLRVDISLLDYDLKDPENLICLNSIETHTVKTFFWVILLMAVIKYFCYYLFAAVAT